MAEQKIIDVTEQKRLNDAREKGIPWKKWGPYLSERQWARSARTTARTATPGTISPMTSRAHGPTGGARTGWGDLR